MNYLLMPIFSEKNDSHMLTEKPKLQDEILPVFISMIFENLTFIRKTLCRYLSLCLLSVILAMISIVNSSRTLTSLTLT